jgi:L-iditol 2-dehydrogenase
VDDSTAALFEPLGVAIHAVDLSRIAVGDSVAVLGAGPIGLCILQVARLSGANPIFVSDKFRWRLDLVKRFGGNAIHCEKQDTVQAVLDATSGRGVDIAIEAAWSDWSVQQAADVVRPGGKLVIVGIPKDDRLLLKHSTARRKELTVHIVRRMKHTHPRVTRLVEEGSVDLKSLITHRFPLSRAPEAFALNAAYQDNVVKVMISP